MELGIGFDVDNFSKLENVEVSHSETWNDDILITSM